MNRKKNTTIKGIMSKRFYNPQTYWQIVYEWEDVFSEKLNSPIVPDKKGINSIAINFLLRNYYAAFYYICYPFRKTLKKKKEKDLYLFFHMNIRNAFNFSVKEKRHIIPYIIDSFFTEKDIPKIYRKYYYCPIVLISSLEVYNYFKSRNCPLNIQYLPLSISDKYKDISEPSNKEYDVVSVGRPNPILDGYMQKYLEKNPNIEYISCRPIRNKNNDTIYEYSSNKKGKIDADFSTRESYIDFLKKGKISFYSTPGVSDSHKTKGFNPVTPRYFEILACQNQLIALYPDTDETRFFELEKVCKSVSSYEIFEETIEKYLNTEPDKGLYKGILEKHYTSERAKKLIELINNL